MFTREKLKAIVQGSVPKVMIIVCLVCLGALTVNVVISAVLRGASAGSMAVSKLLIQSISTHFPL